MLPVARLALTRRRGGMPDSDRRPRAAGTERDALMVSLTYHHALRVTDLVKLRWAAIDMAAVSYALASAVGTSNFFTVIRS
jgi:integrase